MSADMLSHCRADETLRLWNLSALLTSEDSSETDINHGESHYATSPNGSVTDISRKKVSAVLKSYGGCIKCCSFSSNGAFLASGSADNLVRVWRVRGRVLLHSLKGHKNWVLSLAFSPVQEASFATASADGTVRLWDLDKAAPQESCAVLKAKSQAGGVTLGSSKDVTCCSYNALGTLLCTGGADKLVRIWSLPGGTCQRVLHGHRGQVNCLAFQGGSGRLVASVEGNASFHHFSSDNALILWDLEAEAGREVLVRLTGHKRRVNSCSFNGSGALIATGANDNTVRLWMLSPGLQEWGPGEEGRTRSDPCREEAAIDDGSVHLYFGGRDSGSEAGSTTASVSASASAMARSRAEGDDDCEIEEEGDSMGGGVFGALTATGGDGLCATDDVPAKASSASPSRTVSSSLPSDKERSAQTPQDAPALQLQRMPAKRNDSVQSVSESSAPKRPPAWRKPQGVEKRSCLCGSEATRCRKALMLVWLPCPRVFGALLLR